LPGRRLKAVQSLYGWECQYVLSGPAELDGETLKFTPIPPRSRFPVKVTVVAWQWSRSIEPKRKTADPVERTFQIVNQA
jgi:hypothetical protein